MSPRGRRGGGEGWFAVAGSYINIYASLRKYSYKANEQNLLAGKSLDCGLTIPTIPAYVDFIYMSILLVSLQ